METVGLTVLVGADHARMDDARAVARLTQEPLDRDGVAPEARAQYFERTRAALGVLRAVDFRRPALAHALEQAVAGDRPAHVSLAGHGTRETNVRIRG